MDIKNKGVTGEKGHGEYRKNKIKGVIGSMGGN